MTSESLELKADKKSRAVFAILGMIVLAPMLAAFLLKQNLWDGFVLTMGLCLFPQLWLSAFRIWIYPDGIVYKSLFSKKQRVNYDDILEARIDVGLSQSRNGGTLPYYRMLISRTDCDKPLIINLKPFERTGLSELAKNIVANATKAKIDKKVVSLSSSVKSIEQEGIGKLWKVVLFILIALIVIGLIRLFLGIAT